MPPEPKNDYETKLIRTVQEDGWQVTSVIDPERKEPGFAYSIGIYETMKRPEILIIGVHPRTAARMINSYGENLRIGVRNHEAGAVKFDLLPGFEVIFIEANEAAKTNYARSCKWYYQGVSFPLVQCVWQSEDHIWPWDAGAGEALKRDQPLCGEIPQHLR